MGRIPATCPTITRDSTRDKPVTLSERGTADHYARGQIAPRLATAARTVLDAAGRAEARDAVICEFGRVKGRDNEEAGSCGAANRVQRPREPAGCATGRNWSTTCLIPPSSVRIPVRGRLQSKGDLRALSSWRPSALVFTVCVLSAVPPLADPSGNRR